MVRRRFKSPDLQRTYDRSIGRDPERIGAYEEALADAEVGMMVHDLRISEGLTQAQLARRIGTTASAISRVESADYRGHSLAMLRRIAASVGMQVVVRFAPGESSPRPGWTLDKARKEASRKATAADKAPGTRRQRSPARRSRPARRSA